MLPSWVSQLTWLDWVLLLVLVGAVFAGARRGLILSVLDLGALLASAVLAARYEAPAAVALSRFTQVPAALLGAVAYLAIFFLLQMAFGWIVTLLGFLFWPLTRALRMLQAVNTVLGAGVGLVSGIFWLALVLVPIGVFPLPPPVTATMQGSRITQWIVGSPVAGWARLAASAEVPVPLPSELPPLPVPFPGPPATPSPSASPSPAPSFSV